MSVTSESPKTNQSPGAEAERAGMLSKMRPKLLAPALAVAVGALVLGLWGEEPAQAQSQSAPPARPVTVAVAEQTEAAATRWAPGTVVSRHDARISAESGGRITWLAEVGEQIAAGETLAQIDTSDLQLQLRENQARVAQLQAQVMFQRNQFQRLESLAAKQNVSSTQLDEAASQLRVLEQDLTQAQIAGEQIQLRIDQSTITAPFSGQVVERMAQNGEYASPAQALIRLVDTAEREIRVRAPLSVAVHLQQGQSVLVEQEGNNGMAQVRTVIPVADERSRLLELRLTAEDPQWVVGSAVRVALPMSALAERVAIPRDAVILRGDESYVYVVDENNTAQRVDIRTGIGLGDRVEAIGEIAPGDRLVVRGGERLSHGQAVLIKPGAQETLATSTLES